jgi:hypothetical protein
MSAVVSKLLGLQMGSAEACGTVTDCRGRLLRQYS